MVPSIINAYISAGVVSSLTANSTFLVATLLCVCIRLGLNTALDTTFGLVSSCANRASNPVIKIVEEYVGSMCDVTNP